MSASISSVSASPAASALPASQSAPSPAISNASKERHEGGHHKPEATASTGATASGASQSGLAVLQLGG